MNQFIGFPVIPHTRGGREESRNLFAAKRPKIRKKGTETSAPPTFPFEPSAHYRSRIIVWSRPLPKPRRGGTFRGQTFCRGITHKAMPLLRSLMGCGAFANYKHAAPDGAWHAWIGYSANGPQHSRNAADGDRPRADRISLGARAVPARSGLAPPHPHEGSSAIRAIRVIRV
jgi:hypothetical protein